jgi:uncharacterized membrane protein
MTDALETCCSCGKEITRGDAVDSASLARALRSHLPEKCRESASICHGCLTDARMKQLARRLTREKRQLTGLEKSVARKIVEGETVARRLDDDFSKAASQGDRLADSIARVGGSWAFVSGASATILAWLAINLVLGSREAFDPFPFILLNLVLSCVAALQAPVILMSQNRAGARDRIKADHDYEVNLKTELEVAALHAKLDHLMRERWDDLLELQKIQLDVLRRLERERATGSTETR